MVAVIICANKEEDTRTRSNEDRKVYFDSIVYFFLSTSWILNEGENSDDNRGEC